MPGVAQNATIAGLDEKASVPQIRARHPTEPIVLHQSGYFTAADSVKQHSETEPSGNRFHHCLDGYRGIGEILVKFTVRLDQYPPLGVEVI